MATRALTFPFTCTDTSLPLQNMTPLTAFSGALVDYSAKSLTAGAITSWASLTEGGAALTGSATAVVEGGVPHVHLNGVANVLDAAGIVHAQPETVAIRYRLPATLVNPHVIAGASASGSIAMNSSLTNAQIYAGSTLTMSPVVAPDTNWHTMIAVFDGVGAGSIISIDGVERSGSAGSFSRSGLRLGRGAGSSSQYYAIDIRRVIMLTHVANPTERAALLSAANS